MLLRTFTSTLMFVKYYATPRLVLRGDYRETLPPQPDMDGVGSSQEESGSRSDT